MSGPLQREALLASRDPCFSNFAVRLGPGSAAQRYTLHRAQERARVMPRFHYTNLNTTAPNAPAHSAIAAMPWIAKPGPRFAAACE